MLLQYSILVLGSFSGIVSAWKPPRTLFDTAVASKVLTTARKQQSPRKYPSITTSSGQWVWSSPDGWTTGFFPATLYQMHKRECICPGSTVVNGETPDWLALGRTWSAGIVPLHWNNHQGHDVGFFSWPFVDELALHPTNSSARDDIIEFAKELASRYSPVVGATRSWDSPANETDSFSVIIDNMLNLELLLQAHLLTGNRTFYDMAVSHADTTLKHGVRQDWSTWHVIVYDSNTGAVKQKKTAQGFSDSSTWSRGQAWALHGYTRMYQYTKEKRYLEAARNIASYFIRRANEKPGYLVWDFDAPLSPAPPADSSAAMIASAGLYLLSTVEESRKNKQGKAKWINAAHKFLSQSVDYAWKPSWESLLSNGTRNNNVESGNVSKNTGLPYGDYFWVKNGNYALELGQMKCPNGKAPKPQAACGSDLYGASFTQSPQPPVTRG